MRHTFRPAAAACAVAALLAVGCGGDDDADAVPSTTEAPTTASESTEAEPAPEEEPTETTAAVPGAPTEPLTPAGPEWTAACAAGDDLISQSWQLEAGTLTDRTLVAVSMLTMIDELPEGVAPEQVAFVKELINAYVGQGDLEPYRADFRTQAQGLLDAVAEGCGIESGQQLPLPPDVLGEIESFLYD